MGESRKGSMLRRDAKTESVFLFDLNLSGNWLRRFDGGQLAASHLVSLEGYTNKKQQISRFSCKSSAFPMSDLVF
jgi:hypothetical protein